MYPDSEPCDLGADRASACWCSPPVPTAMRSAARVIALIGAVLGLRGHAAALHRIRPAAGGFQFVETRPWIDDLQRQLSPGHRRHVAAADPAQQLHHGAGRDRGLGGDQEARRAIHGGVPDPVGPDERRVLRARCAAVLRVLRSHADPDVHHHRRLGRARTASMRRSSSSCTRCSARCCRWWR